MAIPVGCAVTTTLSRARSEPMSVSDYREALLKLTFQRVEIH
jgi:hypothetical protein